MQSKKQLLALLALCALGSANAFAERNTPLKYWFDRPTTMRGQAVWLASSPDRMPTERQLVRAGDLVNNPDPEWESQSLPIGNGNIGGNVLGSVEAERITFNEKTLSLNRAEHVAADIAVADGQRLRLPFGVGVVHQVAGTHQLALGRHTVGTRSEPHCLSAHRRRTVEPIFQRGVPLGESVGRPQGTKRKKRKELFF
jgi:hypothetical protein